MNKTFNFSGLAKSCLAVYNYQTVRWLPRKPFWHGIAKSKITKVKKPKIYPQIESNEYTRLSLEYRYLENSIVEFIKLGNEKNETKFEGKFNEDLQKEIELSLKINDEWNSEIAKKREERMKLLMDKNLEFVKETKNRHEEKRKLRQLRADEIVRKEIEKSKSFVTLENLDEKIEESIKNIKDYNFAIDLKGQKYEGSETFKKLKEPVKTIKFDPADDEKFL